MRDEIPRWQRKREALRRRLPALAEWIDHPLVEVMVEQAMRRPGVRGKQFIYHIAGMAVLFAFTAVAMNLISVDPQRVLAMIAKSPIVIIISSAILGAGANPELLPPGTPWRQRSGLCHVYQTRNWGLIEHIWLTPARLRDLVLLERFARHCRPISKSQLCLFILWVGSILSCYCILRTGMARIRPYDSGIWQYIVGMAFYLSLEYTYHIRSAAQMASQRMISYIIALKESNLKRIRRGSDLYSIGQQNFSHMFFMMMARILFGMGAAFSLEHETEFAGPSLLWLASALLLIQTIWLRPWIERGNELDRIEKWQLDYQEMVNRIAARN